MWDSLVQMTNIFLLFQSHLGGIKVMAYLLFLIIHLDSMPRFELNLPVSRQGLISFLPFRLEFLHLWGKTLLSIFFSNLSLLLLHKNLMSPFISQHPLLDSKQPFLHWYLPQLLPPFRLHHLFHHISPNFRLRQQPLVLQSDLRTDFCLSLFDLIDSSFELFLI